jgi:hypothetical protein
MPEERLAYARSRWRWEPGAPLCFDEACRLAHLPLVVTRVLESHGPLRYRLGGPFCGVKNHGRIYFATYPEQVGEDDAFALLQDAVRSPRTALYLLGYYNLCHELTPAQAADLSDFLQRWADATVAELTLISAVVIASHDDLALDSHVVARSG